jgi:hypothetical protein
MSKSIQQILNEQRELGTIHKKTSQQIAVTIANSSRERTDEEKKKNSESNRKFRKENPYTEERKKRTGDAMRGKTLEEMLGKERAAEGRKARSEASKGKKRPPEVGQKIAATRRANNSYGTSMLGKEHKESTKATMAIKAKIRQDLKRTLGLGRDGKLPKELLEAEYKKHGL